METQRARLRRFNHADFDNLVELESDEDVMRFTGPGAALPLEKIKERFGKLLTDEEVWAAELKDTRAFVGWFMLKRARFDAPELGFMLVKRHWGKGLATEIAAKLVEHGLESSGKVVATARPQNPASIRILEKLGMKCLKRDATSHYYEISATP